MKKVTLILIIFFICNFLFAQSDSVKYKKNIIFIRLGTVSCFDGGTPLIYSLDYDRIMWSKNKLKCTISLGFSVSPWSMGAPLNINLLVGKKICLESGIGVTFNKPLTYHYEQYLYLSFNPVGLRYTGKKGFTTFCKFGYFYGDFRWVRGDMFYDKNCNHGYYACKKPINKFHANINAGIGYTF